MKNKVNHGPYESQRWIDDIDVANTPLLVAEVGRPLDCDRLVLMITWAFLTKWAVCQKPCTPV